MLARLTTFATVLMLVACSGQATPPGSAPGSEEPAGGPVTEGDDEDGVAGGSSEAERELYFAYRDDLDLSARCPSAQTVGAGAVRGYVLSFAAPTEPGLSGLLTMEPVRAGATVSGIVLSIETECLEALLARDAQAGYERFEVHVERPGGEIVASSVILRSQYAPPSREYVTRLGSAWTAGGLETAALDEAEQRSRRQAP